MHKRPAAVALEDYARIHRPDLTAAEAAERLGVTPRTVARYRARLGLSQASPGGAARPSPELLAEIAARLDDGWPFKEVSETFHVCHKTLTRYFPGRAWSPSQVGKHAKLVRST